MKMCKCVVCSYLGDKHSFPLPNDKPDVFEDNPLMKHYYCCCGDCNQYSTDVSVKNIQECECFEDIW